MKRTTIGDVALAAGVSVATVSRVLNGGPVKEATANRVWDSATRLEYTPNALTKSIFAGRSNTIGVIIDDLRSPFYLDLMRGVDDVADANGSLVMFANAFRNTGKEVAQVRVMDEQRVRGLVLTSGEVVDERARRMASGGTPCVVIARTIQNPPPRLHSVALDNVFAGRLIAQHLIASNRRSIGVISAGDRPSQLARIEGLRLGLRDAGLELDEMAIATVNDDSDALNAIEHLLKGRPSIDAIACLAGRRTVAVYAALMATGRSIPADIAFLTMDDFPWAEALGVTVVAQPSYRMGQQAAELIVENPESSARLTFDPELIVRTSCGEGA